jgi:PAS domain S-box-containing protein
MAAEKRFAGEGVGSDRYRRLVEAITDYAIYMLDPSGIVVSWNAGAERFKGYTADEILGQHFSRFYTEEDRAAGLPEKALRIAAEEGRFELEGWRVRKDGTRFWADVVIDPIRGPDGEIQGFAKITRDLTERRQAEQALRRSQEQFRLLVQGVTDYAIYMLDPAGLVSSWNLGAHRIKGYAPEEIIGQHFSRFYTDDDRAAGVPEHGLATAAREGRWETEAWRVRKDGSRFWAHVVLDCIRDETGEIAGFAKITRDITERREAQRALEEAREALFQSQKMEAVGQLTGGVAHDFNNLLTVILGGLDTIRRSKPGETARVARALDMSIRATERAASLTSRLLAFSRRQPLRPSPADLNIVVRDMSELLHRTLGEDIDLECVLAQRLWTVNVDRNQLESAILNLAVNARDAMPDGGKLTIETANTRLDETYAESDAEVTPGQYAVVAVSDTGMGMDRATLDRVFEPFFTTKEVGRGTGLGLSMVYGFVKQSGGHIKIYSEEGHGTTFKIYLPRADMQAGRDTDSDASPLVGGCETVLAVEDDPAVRASVIAQLESLGYKVLTAANGEEALAAIVDDVVFDLLFTDVIMPGPMNGRRLAEEAMKRRTNLKVLFTSGYTESAIMHHGRLDPGVFLLPKPYRKSDLARMIRLTLSSAEQRPSFFSNS